MQSRPLADTNHEDSLNPLEFLKVDRKRGRLLLFGHPVLLLWPENLADLQEHLEAISGKAAKGMLYRVSFWSGQETARSLWGGDPSPQDSGEIDAYLRRASAQIAFMGLGTVEVTVADLGAPDILWVMPENTTVPLHAESKEPVCHLQAGFFAGVASTILGRPIEVRETECRAKGDLRCAFRARAAPSLPI